MHIEIKDDANQVIEGKVPRRGHPNLVRAMTSWLRYPPYGHALRVLALYHAPRGRRGERLRVYDLVEGPRREEKELISDIMEVAWGHAEGLKGEQPYILEAFFGEGGGNKDICLFPVHARLDDDIDEGLDHAGTDKSERRQVQRGIDRLLSTLENLTNKANDRHDKQLAQTDVRLEKAYARIDKLESAFDGSMVKRVGAIEAIELLKDRTSSRNMDEEERRSRIKMKEQIFSHFNLLLPIIVSKFRLGGGQPQPLALPMVSPVAALPPAPMQTAPIFAGPVASPVQASVTPGYTPVYPPPVAYGPPSPLSYLDDSYVPPAPPQAPQSAPASPAQPSPPTSAVAPAAPTDLPSAMGHLRQIIVSADDALVARLMPAFSTMSMPQQTSIAHFVQKCREPEGPGEAEIVGLRTLFDSMDQDQSERFMRALPEEIRAAIAAVAFYMLPKEERDKIEAMNAGKS